MPYTTVAHACYNGKLRELKEATGSMISFATGSDEGSHDLGVVLSDTGRTNAFVESLTSFVKMTNFDGIDLNMTNVELDKDTGTNFVILFLNLGLTLDSWRNLSRSRDSRCEICCSRASRKANSS